MKYIEFTNKEKVEMFDEIADKFYNHNFGTFSKSEMELLMFNFYIKKLVDMNVQNDNTLNYNASCDYYISKELGITQQKVNNLKVKNQLVNPIDFDWKKSFLGMIQNARIDDKTRKVFINIPDPNLYIEIKHYLEEKGGYIDTQLNKGLLKIRAEYFIQLLVEIEPEINRKTIIKEIKKKIREENKDERKLLENNVGTSLLDLAVNTTDIISSVLSLVATYNTNSL
ncbi:MAG: hypothetical protein EGR46_04985 [Ruminococcus sp.]|uniref:hypothetical protein n=1 Tax=Ruminococcus sp. TaxID=41978 RepID=UPI0025EFBE22|nr:hypothetical protein [Ruminococcus sp.]MBD9048278.1 hypothetical protein [Ruminococcus sp.]